MELNWRTPLLLYLATFFTTTFCRFGFDNNVLFHSLYAVCMFAASGGRVSSETLEPAWAILWDALLFSVPLMFILTCHEFGHYFQSRRYGVHSSLPYFLPIPFGLLGTLGAVIAMDDRVPNSRALFDIGITGPLAGLVPTLFFLYFGLQWSQIGPASGFVGQEIGNPLLFTWTANWLFGNIPPDMTLYIHPFATAAWVGLLLTSLNLMPFGQLDGGHIFHSLLGKYSGIIAKIGFVAVIILVIYYRLWHWSLMLIILLGLIGITHPPTQNDSVRLGWFRRGLGWATLLFVIIGFAPSPLPFDDVSPEQKTPRWYCSSEPQTKYAFTLPESNQIVF